MQLLTSRLSRFQTGQRRISEWIASLVGPGALTTKVYTTAVAAAVILLLTVQGNFEVTADATLEGLTQQAVVAPYNGFIAESVSRAGDLVKAEQLLGKMDDRNLSLELQRIGSEKEELERQYRQALSDLNQSEARIFKARVDEADARWSLLKRRLDQVELRSPIDGIIITGDLSRSIGAPVERGDLLFEVAPLEKYRIVLRINESDIDEIEPGQSGEVILTSHPNLKIPFVLENIASVLQSEQDLGVVFRTEGVIQEDYNFLRPGMEGVARVTVGERTLAWIFFHDIIDWVYLKIWRWSP